MMTTSLIDSGKNDRNSRVRVRVIYLCSYGAGIIIILLMGNLNGLIDAVIHPEIRYFDEEHLIVGGITSLVTAVLFLIVMHIFSKLLEKENELQKLNKELENQVERRTRELVETQERLLHEEKLAMLGRIAGNMGNELRNPLGVMSNAVFYLQNVLTDADETTREYLEIIGKEIDNAKNIISDLLDYCSGRSPRREPVTVHQLIRQCRESCTIPENIGFHADMPETLPQALVDPLQMGKVFQNLIANAVQAMPEGGVLRIEARQEDTFIEIAVTDSGEGIQPENMKKLFQPLFTTKSRGIGLGLAIAGKLTEANGGRIEVASELGKGTTFTVILPLSRTNI